jgi:hypothetical protein
MSISIFSHTMEATICKFTQTPLFIYLCHCKQSESKSPAKDSRDGSKDGFSQITGSPKLLLLHRTCTLAKIAPDPTLFFCFFFFSFLCIYCLAEPRGMGACLPKAIYINIGYRPRRLWVTDQTLISFSIPRPPSLLFSPFFLILCLNYFHFLSAWLENTQMVF